MSRTNVLLARYASLDQSPTEVSMERSPPVRWYGSAACSCRPLDQEKNFGLELIVSFSVGSSRSALVLFRALDMSWEAYRHLG